MPFTHPFHTLSFPDTDLVAGGADRILHVLEELTKASLPITAAADLDGASHTLLWGFTSEYIPLSPQNSPVKGLFRFHSTDDKTELGEGGQSDNFPQARELVSTELGPKLAFSVVNYLCPYP